MTGLPFTITLDSQGFYRVSIPNYEGGEVVTVEDANAAIAAAVQAEREACAKICDENARDNDEQYSQWKSIASNPQDIGVMKFCAYSGQAQRDAAAIRARNGDKR